MYQKLIIALFGVLFVLTACQKPEGEGGTSSITGYVFVNDYDNNGNLRSSYYAPNETIYIVYGTDNTIYDDSRKTNYDCAYEFKDLFAGE